MRLLVLVAGCAGVGPAAGDTDPASGDTDVAADSTLAPDETGPWPEAPTPPPTGLCSVDGWCWVEPAPHGLELTAVHGTGPDDVWAVGAVGLVQHFDGASWSYELLDGTGDLGAVVVDVPGEPCVAGWDGTLLCRRDGAWRDEAPPGRPSLVALARAPGGHLWAVGADGVYEQADGGWVRHRDGAWHVVALADDDVWVADYAADEVQHYDGERWTSLPTDDDVYALAGTPEAGVWAAGAYELFHPDGDRFVAVPDVGVYTAPVPRLALRALGDGALVATIDSARYVWTPDGWVLEELDPILGWPGTRAWWERVDAVWGAGLDDLWAVGARGTLRRWDGVAWSREGGPLDDDHDADRRAEGGVLVAAPRGGVIWGGGFRPQPLRRREGAVRRAFDVPDTGDGITGLAVDGPRVWVSQDGVEEPFLPYGGGPQLASWHDPDGWHTVRDGVLAVIPSERRHAAWVVTDGDDCQWRELDVDGVLGDPWPPAPPDDMPWCAPWLVMGPRLGIEVVAPPHLAWWSQLEAAGGGRSRSDLWGYEGGAWHHATLPREVHVGRHPVTGGSVLVTDALELAHLDGDTLVVDRALGEPGDEGGPLGLVGDELALQARPHVGGSLYGARPVLIFWDGEHVRREALPSSGVDRIVREADGRTWASAGDDLLVHEPR